MLTTVINCTGCGAPLQWDGTTDIRCDHCGTFIPKITSFAAQTIAERLSIAAGYRRVGNFDDSQQELDSILEEHNGLSEALFASFLNYYEVSDYAFNPDNTVRVCKCASSSWRGVEENKDYIQAINGDDVGSERKAQWTALAAAVEKERQLNEEITDSLPRYRAILLCDYSMQEDMDAAHALYDMLSKKTDIFFPPISLKKISDIEDKEKYLKQVLINPTFARIMFVLYSDAFSVSNRTATRYYTNLAKQVKDFGKVHEKYELFSVTSEIEPPPLMKRYSIKAIYCDDFSPDSVSQLADSVMDGIVKSTKSVGKFGRGDDVQTERLNDEGYSPIVKPIKK